MNFAYQFPAVRGVQAGREYYISMVPLKLLSKLFPSDDEIVAPEYRTQRKINEARIPEIKKYILENRNNYADCGKNAREYFEQHFAQEIHFAELEE